MRRFACLLLLALGCNYDPPPEVGLPLPSDGVFLVGTPLTITFTEPVNPDTLVVHVWPAAPEDRTADNEHRPGLEPTIESCRPRLATSKDTEPNCALGSALVLSEDRKSAELRLGIERFGKAKVPWQLEVATGLADDAGRPTGSPRYFDFQFSPSGACSGDLVEFHDDIYLLVAPIQEPVATTLQMYLDVRTQPDGEFVWAGGKARYTGADKGTADPAQLTLDRTDRGFAIFPVGCVRPDGGDRFVATEPFDIFINLSGIEINMKDVRVAGAVLPDPATGFERIEGTISFSKLILNFGEPFEYPPGNAPFAMTRMPKELIPDDLPNPCGDLCGGVTVQCNPKEDFPDPKFCEEDPAADGSDSADASDGADGTDSADGADGTDATDAAADATDATDATDAADATDGSDSTDTTDGTGG